MRIRWEAQWVPLRMVNITHLGGDVLNFGASFGSPEGEDSPLPHC